MWQIVLLALLAREGAALPGPAEAQTGTEASAFPIAPLDVLEISVFREEELSRRYTVDSKGSIQMPLIGDVRVEGLEPPVAASRIAARLADGYLVAPKVSVVVVESKTRFVTVAGPVKSPGKFPFHEGLTAFQAILDAGDFTPEADPNETRIVRGTGDERTTIEAHLGDLIAKGGAGSDVTLEPGDLVVASPRSAVVFVLGQVATPGAVPYKEGLTALRAVLAAGNFTKFA